MTELKSGASDLFLDDTGMLPGLIYFTLGVGHSMKQNRWAKLVHHAALASIRLRSTLKTLWWRASCTALRWKPMMLLKGGLIQTRSPDQSSDNASIFSVQNFGRRVLVLSAAPSTVKRWMLW